MKILVLGTNFHPEVTGVAPLTTDLCDYLVQQGHTVEVICTFPHYPEWAKRKENKWKIYDHHNYKGVTINRVWNYVPRRLNTITRVMYDTIISFSFLIGSFFIHNKPKVILAICSPLQVGFSAWIISKRFNVPFYFHLQDLIPESAANTGMIKNKYFIGIIENFAKFIYNKAAGISVIGHSFKETIIKLGVAANKISYLPNWVDTQWIKPLPKSKSYLKELSIDSSKYIVMYIGNIGKKQDLITLAAAAGILKSHDDIIFIIFGDGNNKKQLVDYINKYSLNNILLYGVQSKSKLPVMLSIADALVVLQKKEVINMVVPSKLLIYAASGKPIILAGNSNSEGSKFIVESNGGLLVEAENHYAVAEKIQSLKNSNNDGYSMHGRKYVEKRFSKELVLNDFEKHLLQYNNTK